MEVTVTETCAVVGTAVAALGFFWKVHSDNVRAIKSSAEERAVIKDRVDALWRLQLDRARMKSEEDGEGKRNSPFSTSPETRKKVPPSLAEGLRLVYSSMNPSDQADEVALSVALLRAFRQRILDDLCRPNRWEAGQCLLVAMDVAREEAA